MFNIKQVYIIILYFRIIIYSKHLSDVQLVTSVYPPGTLRKMVCYFVKTIIGPLTAKRVRTVARSSQAPSCWRAITSSIQNVLPVLRAVLSSETARVMRSSNDPNCTVGFVTSGRCSHSTERQTTLSPENHTALGWSKYLPVRQIRTSKEELSSR